MITASQRRRWLLTLTVALPLTGCADETVSIPTCDNGVLDEGELCLRGALRIIEPALEPHALRVADFDGDLLEDLMIIGLAPTVTAELWRGVETRDRGVLLDAPLDPGVHGCSAHPVPGQLGARLNARATDILFATCQPRLHLFAPDDEGRFGQVDDLPLTGLPRTTKVVDVDGDERADVVALIRDPEDEAQQGLNVLLGDGAHGLMGTVETSLAGADFSPTNMEVADVDGDGLADAILLERGRADGLRVAHGVGGGGFARPEPLFTMPSPAVMATGDLDGDGAAEVVVGDLGVNMIVALTSRGVPTPTIAGAFIPSHPRDAPAYITLADVNNDDLLDAVMLAVDSPRVWIAEGLGDGGFFPPSIVEFDDVVHQVALADVNADGAIDLVAGTFDSGTVTVRLASP